MKEVEGIDTKNKVDEMTEEERDDLFTRLVLGKDVTEEIETSQGSFTVKYPKPKDILAVGKLAAYRRNYRPAEGFDATTEMDNMMASTLDVIVVSGPSWYERAKKTVPNFSFLEVPSRAFIAELYGKAYSFRSEVEKRLETKQKPKRKRVSPKTSANDPVDGGTFGGLSSEQDDTSA
jgi:hypothetical protein